jgi:LmbE family N-acetylglucosaminyl deacetylase
LGCISHECLLLTEQWPCMKEEETRMSWENNPPSLLVLGAHPDDCEYSAGGLAALYAQRGGRVRFVSLTNGDAGHHELGGGPLARIRREEAARAAAVIGIESLVLDHHDGELQPTLDLRREVIDIIREFQPDLVLSLRPYDYHPDHRAAAILVRDAAYMVTVPNVATHIDHLSANPVIMYVSDEFQRPEPLTPDVVENDDQMKVELGMREKHASQQVQLLPFRSAD